VVAAMQAGATARDEALEWARSARAARRQVRHDLSTGIVELPEVLVAAGSDRFLSTVRLLWVLESMPGARKIDTRRTLAHRGIDGELPLGELTDAERSNVVTLFPGAGARS
jgi:hypothetical protein